MTHAIQMDQGREPGSHAACPRGRARDTFSVRHECACDAANCPGGADVLQDGWGVCGTHAARMAAGDRPVSWAPTLARVRAEDPARAAEIERYHRTAHVGRADGR